MTLKTRPLKQSTTHVSGFTLIELLISVVIIGLITSIAIPSYTKLQTSAKENIVKTITHSLQMSIETYNLSIGEHPPSQTIDELIRLLQEKDCYSDIPKNPFTREPYSQNDPSGKITYIYNETTESYKLTGYGKKNTAILLTLEN
ncbi:MAG: prepilin-type N-terminal cleavage/methylation domain-containing protein [bacterium]